MDMSRVDKPPPHLTTHAAMTHGYSLRPNTKGRRRHQSIDKTDDQVEGTTTSTSLSTSTSNTSERGHETLTDELEGESGTVDPRPITPDTPRAAAHNNSPTQDSAKQDDWQRHSRRSIVTSSAAIGATSTTVATTRYRVNGPPQTWEDIQAARKREEARCIVEARRIRREQIVRGYEEELRSLRARIVALRLECEVEVEKARRKWERDRAMERGEVAVVVEDGEEEEMLVGPNEEDWEDANPTQNSKMIEDNYMPTETPSLTTDNDKHQQWQWSSQCTPHWSRSGGNFQPPPLQINQKQQQHLQSQRHQSHMGSSPLSARDMMVGPSRPSQRLEPELEATEEDSDERGPPAGETRKTPSQGRKSHPQPLRRQPAQLMAIPTSSPSRGSAGSHTYASGTAVLDLEICFGGTDGDNDSEMDG